MKKLNYSKLSESKLATERESAIIFAKQYEDEANKAWTEREKAEKYSIASEYSKRAGEIARELTIRHMMAKGAK